MFEGDPRGGEPGVQGRDVPPRVLEVLGQGPDVGDVARSERAGRPPPPHGDIGGEGGPARPVLGCECALGLETGLLGGGAVAVEQGRLGREQQRLGEVGSHPRLPQQPDDLLGTGARLAHDSHGEQGLAAVEHGADHLLGRQRLDGAVIERKGRGDVAPPGGEEPEVGVDHAARVAASHLGLQLLGPPQVGLGRRVLTPVGVEDRPVDARLHLVEGGARLLQGGDGGAVLDEGLCVATETLEQQGTLHAQQHGVGAGEVRCGSFDLFERLSGLAFEEQGVAELGSGQRFGVGRSRVLGGGDRSLEMVLGGGEIVQLPRDQTQCSLRRRTGDVVAGGDRLGQRGRGELARLER